MRRTVIALLPALVCAAHAQRTVVVHLPPGDSVAFASKGLPTAAPEGLTAPKGDVATVEVAPGEDTLVVWARGLNRAATTPVKAGEWTPKMAEMTDLGQVIVEVRYGDGHVAAANVTLDDGRRKQEVLLDPGKNGDATFFAVKPGSLKVTVRYNAEGKDAEPVTQVFTAKAEGDVPPRFKVSVPENTATVEAAAKPLSSPGERGKAGGADVPARGDSRATGGGFNLVGTLFALLVGGGAAAGIWYFIKKNPDTVGGTLEKLGAQIPKPGDAPLADPPVAAAPTPIAPEPPQKIVLDPVAPAPSAASIQLASPVTASEPSLVSDAGVPIPLAEGETVVGREVGLGLSLASESTVSRRHARLVRSGGAVTLFDEGSTNGTFVNGGRISGSANLNPGDQVQFGSVRFRYEG